jgi:YVTN family beta-propeller protein
MKTRDLTAKIITKMPKFDCNWSSSVSVSVGANPTGVAVTPDGARVYVTNYLSNNVSVISTATNTVVNTMPVGTRPIAIAINSNGTSAYVPNDGDNAVSVINIAANAVAAAIPVQNNPRGVAISPMGRYVYVSNRISNTVSVIDALSNTVVSSVGGVGVFPEAVAITVVPNGTGCS